MAAALSLMISASPAAPADVSAVGFRIRVPAEIAFGDPLEVGVEFLNHGPASAEVYRLSPWSVPMQIVDATSGGVVLDSVVVAPIGEQPTVVLSPGQSSIERANLWTFAVGANWINAKGRLVTQGLLYPGEFRIVARTRLASPPQTLRAEAAFRVTSAGREHELDLVRAATRSPYKIAVATTRAQWASLVRQLRACCSDSPVLEPVFRASCLSAMEPSDVAQCTAEFERLFPSSEWLAEVKGRVKPPPPPKLRAGSAAPPGRTTK